MGMQTGSLGNIGFIFRGKWTASSYSRNDVVTHDNAIYVAVRSTLPSEIPKASDAWAFMIEGFISPYTLCEFYYFRHPNLKPGFQPATGGILENAATLYPKAWAYLQSEEGQLLCTTEEEWQAMTHAVWHTNADGTEVGWNGIGGAPFYVLDVVQETIRLPDLRGMYAEAAGFDSLGVGGTHGDAVRNIVGNPMTSNFGGVDFPTGAYYRTTESFPAGDKNAIQKTVSALDISRVVPVANKVQPRAYGVLACVYLGIPR